MRRIWLTVLLAALCLTGCGSSPPPETDLPRMELRYAEGFSVAYRPDGCTLVTVGEGERFLLLPEDGPSPEDTGGAAVIHANPTLYLAASSVMDFFVRLNALDAVRMTGTAQGDWSLPAVREALADGRLLYAGKYSAPDVELLLAEGCTLAVESTMIYHAPQIKEQLEALGIPVLVDRSSYEPHPLGRMEWIKLYGLLAGKAAEAEAFFEEQAGKLETMEAERAETGRRAAVFSLSPSGTVQVRKPGDYLTALIELAGGQYVFSQSPEDDSFAVNLQMEAFYDAAREADVLIYNGAIDGGMETLDQLLDKSALFGDFRAVRTGEVWCTERNLYQEITAGAAVAEELRAILSGTAEEPLVYLHRLK